MRTLLAFLLLLPLLAAQCPPEEQAKDLEIVNDCGKLFFDQVCFQPLADELAKVYATIGLKRAAYPCNSSWHKLRTVADDVVSLYGILGVQQLSAYYKLDANPKVAALRNLQTLAPRAACDTLRQYLDELKVVIGLR